MPSMNPPSPSPSTKPAVSQRIESSPGALHSKASADPAHSGGRVQTGRYTGAGIQLSGRRDGQHQTGRAGQDFVDLTATMSWSRDRRDLPCSVTANRGSNAKRGAAPRRAGMAVPSDAGGA